MFVNLIKMCVAGMIAGAICCIGAVQYDKFVHLSKIPFEFLKISLIAFICLVVYIPLNLIMKMEYANELFARIKSKFLT